MGEVSLVSYAAIIIALKGGAGSGNFNHAGVPGKVGGSAPGGGHGSASNRVWEGKQHAQAESKLSKLEVGHAGEKLAMQVLSEKMGVPFGTLNVGVNNAPIDVGGDHTAVEVKTGLATNGSTAQHWRATIGQPGKAEAELISQMSSEEKRQHNAYKYEQIMKRKNDMLAELTKQAGGEEVKPLTVGIILSADGKRGDVYMIPGFHLRLPWKDYATDEYYAGSYDV